MKHLIRVSSIFAFVILLNGCQTLPDRFSADVEKGDKHPAQQYILQHKQTLVGRIATVELEEHDSLATIGRYFGLGFDEIVRANPGLDPWMPEPGSMANLPMRFILPEAPHEGIIINLPARRLYYYPAESPDTVYSYPVGIGRQGWRTPVGKTRITAKKSKPSWTPPPSIRKEHERKGDSLPKVVPAGPDNPLGEYALYLGMRGYLIHGTNKPYGVGMSISHGCVRLYPEDIAELFRLAPVGTQVRIIDEPYLTAWDDGILYLQAYPVAHKNKRRAKQQRSQIVKHLKTIEKKTRQPLDWSKVQVVLDGQEGVPVLISETSIASSKPQELSHPPFGFGDTIPGELTTDSWRLHLKETGDEHQAKRLVAMLNHQGPPIPAHVHEKQVIIGPFISKDEAGKAAGRIRREFSIDSEMLKPGEDYVKVNLSGGPKSWFNGLTEYFGAK